MKTKELDLGHFKKVHSHSLGLEKVIHYEYDDVSIQISLTPHKGHEVAIHVIASNFSKIKGVHKIPSKYGKKLRLARTAPYPVIHNVYIIEYFSKDGIRMILREFNLKLDKVNKHE